MGRHRKGGRGDEPPSNKGPERSDRGADRSESSGGEEKGREVFALRFHEGYKGRETPRALVIGGRELIIQDILSRERRRTPGSTETEEVFTCRMEGQVVRITVKASGSFDVAFLREPDQSG